MAFGLFGVGMGMVNGQITVAAVSGMPPSHAGLASGVASASRQVGQTLGVAITGSLLTTAASGRGQPASALAGHPAWHVLFWWAFAVVICGLLTSRTRARHGKTREVRRLLRQQPPLHPQIPAQPAAAQAPTAQPESIWTRRLMGETGSPGGLAPGQASRLRRPAGSSDAVPPWDMVP